MSSFIFLQGQRRSVGRGSLGNVVGVVLQETAFQAVMEEYRINRHENVRILRFYLQNEDVKLSQI